MRVLVHDYSGHPFQAELSRGLAARGHRVLHSYCEAHNSGKGRLSAGPGEKRFAVEPIGTGETVEKLSFRRRLIQELRFGVQLARQVRRHRPDVVMLSNVPIPMLFVFTAFMALRRAPWVLWQQDVQAVAMRSFAGTSLPRAFRLVAALSEVVERWASRRAAAVVVIADSFLDVHREWGTADKTTVIPNWAPLDEIVPVDRHNAWSAEQGIDDVLTLVYSGTLGLKHNPALLPALARSVRDRGVDAHLVVVTEGPAVPVVQSEAERLGVPLTLLPFQPYERLPEVLGSGDLLVVLLEQEAGAFSVPSKTLSYLCSGRPVLGLMPPENLAASLITDAGGFVLPPVEGSLEPMADWAEKVLSDHVLRAQLGASSRTLAEQEFALAGCADAFEDLLIRACPKSIASRLRAGIASLVRVRGIDTEPTVS